MLPVLFIAGSLDCARYQNPNRFEFAAVFGLTSGVWKFTYPWRSSVLDQMHSGTSALSVQTLMVCAPG
jgi:hypothetical protein